ncbi:hypothetical protein B0H14DRAFT_2623708 [Mycena olivaceomarginata]|nr:hypothetical protein B0H14DRAFT_2623708 [Mycena olivaceomarginata]
MYDLIYHSVYKSQAVVLDRPGPTHDGSIKFNHQCQLGHICYIPQVGLPLGCLPVTAHVTLFPAKKEPVVYAGLPRPTYAESALWTGSNMHIEHNFQLQLRIGLSQSPSSFSLMSAPIECHRLDLDSHERYKIDNISAVSHIQSGGAGGTGGVGIEVGGKGGTGKGPVIHLGVHRFLMAEPDNPEEDSIL